MFVNREGEWIESRSIATENWNQSQSDLDVACGCLLVQIGSIGQDSNLEVYSAGLHIFDFVGVKISSSFIKFCIDGCCIKRANVFLFIFKFLDNLVVGKMLLKSWTFLLEIVWGINLSYTVFSISKYKYFN